MKNPFETGQRCPFTGVALQVANGADRVRLVKRFTRAECEAALKMAWLQRSVEQAVRRRLKAFEKEANV